MAAAALLGEAALGASAGADVAADAAATATAASSPAAATTSAATSSAVAASPGAGVDLSAGGDGKVVTLTDSTFKAKIAQGGVVFVKFFAPWCSHCAKAEKPFATAASQVTEATFADLDATIHTTTAGAYGVSAYPTYKLFRDGHLLSSYSGAPSVPAFISFVRRALSGDGVKMVPPGGLADWLAASPAGVETSFVGVGLAPDGAFTKTAFDVTGAAGDRARFGLTEAADEAAAAAAAYMADGLADADANVTAAAAAIVAAVKPGVVVAYVAASPHLPRRVRVYDGGPNGVGDWVKAAALGAFRELTASHTGAYLHSGAPVAILIVDGDAPDASTAATFAAVALAAEARDKGDRGTGRVVLAWGSAESSTVAPFRTHLGLAKAPLPALAIYAFAHDATFVYRGALEAAPITAWLIEYAKGSLAATVKSEEAPTESPPPGAVVKVVGTTWESVVHASGQDVFIMQWAPWCAHSKAARPALEATAAALRGVRSVTIAAMDATANDPPVGYRTKNYPTFHFFRSGEARGLEYKTRRAVSDFVDYIREHAATPFEVDLAAATAAGEAVATAGAAPVRGGGDKAQGQQTGAAAATGASSVVAASGNKEEL